MARLRFTKMHGIGNDYVYVDCFAQQVADPAALARRLSPRRTAVGSDGVILIYPSPVADCRMEMYNADGSRGEMCGNGIRCVGKYVYEHGLVPQDTLDIETDAGIKRLRLHSQTPAKPQEPEARNRHPAPRIVAATVDMGEPVLDGPRIPVAAEGRVIDAPLEVGGARYRVTCVSMGNPHCVVFVPDVDTLAVDQIGPAFEHHAFFPKRVNTEFVTVLDRTRLRMRVWERGSGETAACGTGACAVLVAAALTGTSERRAAVRLNGGDLDIEWRADNHVLMTGPAEEVFSGEIEI